MPARPLLTVLPAVLLSFTLAGCTAAPAPTPTVTVTATPRTSLETPAARVSSPAQRKAALAAAILASQTTMDSRGILELSGDTENMYTLVQDPTYDGDIHAAQFTFTRATRTSAYAPIHAPDLFTAHSAALMIAEPGSTVTVNTRGDYVLHASGFPPVTYTVRHGLIVQASSSTLGGTQIAVTSISYGSTAYLQSILAAASRATASAVPSPTSTP
jgi:hypothetical protein